MNPYLFVNMAMTLDGKVARPDGKWYGLNTLSDKMKMDVIRSNADSIIVGKNSILNDDPEIKIRYAEHSVDPRPVILLQTSCIPKNRKIFTLNPIIFCTKVNFDSITEDLGDVSEIYCLSETDVINPLSVVLKLQSLNYSRILLEGGPILNYSFFQQDLIDKIYLTIVPYLIGQNDLPSIVDGKKAFEFFDKKKWKLVSLQNENDEIFLEYERYI